MGIVNIEGYNQCMTVFQYSLLEAKLGKTSMEKSKSLQRCKEILQRNLKASKDAEAKSYKLSQFWEILNFGLSSYNLFQNDCHWYHCYCRFWHIDYASSYVAANFEEIWTGFALVFARIGSNI